jgi:hypothetical protein
MSVLLFQQNLTICIVNNFITRIQIGKEEVKLSLFVDNMNLFLENLEDFIQRYLNQINKLSKAEYKIIIQNPAAFYKPT